jgi:hypothetical protein
MAHGGAGQAKESLTGGCGGRGWFGAHATTGFSVHFRFSNSVARMGQERTDLLKVGVELSWPALNTASGFQA